MRSIVAASALLVTAVLTAPVHSDDPVSSAVTFNREVIRVFKKKCLACHAPGAVAMSLATYRDARPWARAIREELVEQRMPPWSAAPGYGTFSNDIGLTQRELAMLIMWTDGGVPQGDNRDRPVDPPAAPSSAMPAPDQRVPLPLQRIPAGDDAIRRVTVDADAASDRFLRLVRVVPGNRRVLRAAFVFMAPAATAGSSARASGDAAGQWLTAWTPWQQEIALPEGAAFRLPAGARLMVELHYRSGDRAAEDLSSLEIFFAPRALPSVDEVVVEAAALPRGRAGRTRGETTLDQDARIWAIVPRVPEATAGDALSIEVTARKPDGSVEVLLWIPAYRRDWPAPYLPRNAVRLPAGTAVSLTATRALSGIRSRAGRPVSVRLSTSR